MRNTKGVVLWLSLGVLATAPLPRAQETAAAQVTVTLVRWPFT